MTDDQATHQPRYATLRDYLGVLRRYRLMIAALALVGCGVGLLLSLREDSVYEASASIAFQDESSEFAIFGLSTNATRPPTQLAAAKAATVTAPGVLERARRRLSGGGDSASPAGTISTTVDPGSALVSVTASSSDSGYAARFANAVAKEAVRISNKETRERLSDAVRATRRRAEEVRQSAGAAADPNVALLQQAELARLNSLSNFARSAELVQRAEQPDTPVSPKPERSAALGMLGGLLVGLLLAFARDSLDRRLRSAHDIRALYRYPLLGYVRDEAMGRTPYVTSGSNGKRDDTVQVDIEGFRIMRRNLEFLEPGIELRSIVVTSAFPAEGKTTVSAALAFSMAVGGKRTLLVECDFRRPVLAKRLGFESTPGLGDYLAGNAKPQEVLRAVRFTDPPYLNGAAANGEGPSPSQHSLVCIPAGTVAARAAELLGSDRLKQFLEKVGKGYDVVILDSSPLLPVVDTLELLPHVDGIIVCARELQTTPEQARAAQETLERFPERPTALVVTGTRPHEDDYEGYAYSYAYQMHHK